MLLLITAASIILFMICLGAYICKKRLDEEIDFSTQLWLMYIASRFFGKVRYPFDYLWRDWK